jgi:hypothetical protein
MPAFVDIAGQRFGRLIAVAFKMRKGQSYWRCQCDCGNIIVGVRVGDLRNSNTKSCGCLRRDLGIARTRPLAERFWEKVDKNGPMPTACDPSFGNCWLWIASLDTKGRAQLKMPSGNYKGKLLRAAHVAWFLEHGVWPTQHMLHVCDTPACVRHGHLFEGDNDSNQYDRFAKAAGGILIEVTQ